jgi:hypothetical protein
MNDDTIIRHRIAGRSVRANRQGAALRGEAGARRRRTGGRL